jgi:antitoxin component YwqK of YwqJK toxin-antitoxin module
MKKTFRIPLALFLLIGYLNFAQEIVPYTGYDSIIAYAAERQQNGEYEKAIEALERINPNDSTYLSTLVTRSYFNILLKKYDEVIKLTDQGLKADSKDFQSSFVINKVVALLAKEQYEEAIRLCDEALETFPMNKTLWFNKGLSFEGLGRVKEAAQLYQKVILLDPTYKKVYLQLGNLCYRQELMSQALMCYDMYLFLEPDGSDSFSILKSLNEIVKSKNENKADPNVEISLDDKSFSEIDLILNNRIAMNQKYDTGNEIDIALTRQNHALMESLKAFSGKNGFWDRKIVPFFQWIMNNGHFDLFSYTLAYSIENESFKKIVEKNTDDISEFYSLAIQKWKEIAQTNTEEWYGNNQIVTYYYENGRLEGKGKMDGNTPVGPWEFYNDKGRSTIKGSFDSMGNREGKWISLNYEGIITEVAHYANGKLDGKNLQYYDDGKPKKVAIFIDDELNGEFKYYTANGALQQKKYFKNGKLDGTYQYFHEVGEELVYTKAEYIGGNVQEVLHQYYPTGQLESEISFSNGENNGPELNYYPNGQLSLEVNSKDGYWEGPYKSFYPNGTVKENGQTSEGYYSGHWQTFYSDGTLESDFDYGDKGKITGVYKYYDKDGKIHYQYEYRKGDIIAYTFYDKEGVVIAEERKKGGEFYYKSYSPYGKINSEGLYDIKGGKVGEWKFYNSHGLLSDKGNYNDDKLHGENRSYYPNGNLLSKSPYVNDTLNGYYAEYHINGKIKSQGWYKDGQQHGEWRTHAPDGTVTAINYLHKGQLHGEQIFFSGKGIKKSVSIYDFGTNIKEIIYDKKGQKAFEIPFEPQDGKYRVKGYHYNQQPSIEYTYLNGIKHGPFTIFDFYGRKKTTGQYLNGNMHGKWLWFHDNGKVETEANYINGELDGDYIFYYDDGVIDTKYHYLLGNREGEIKSFHENGNLYVKANYLNNEYHGRRETYDPEGNLQIVRFYEHGRLMGYSYLDSESNELPMIPIENETGNIVSYYSNGNVSREMEYKYGVLTNEFKEYYFLGNLWEEAFFVEGEYEGKRIEYFPDGQAKSERVYELGLLNGVSREYFKNGTLKKEVNYLFDVKEGVSKIYNQDGKLQKEETYFNDSIISSSSM